MTARVEAERAIADVLAGHKMFSTHCSCGYDALPDARKNRSNDYIGETLRAHVASLLADLMAERQAKALNEAADAMEWQKPDTGYVVVYPERVGSWLRDRAATYRPDLKDTRDE